MGSLASVEKYRNEVAALVPCSDKKIDVDGIFEYLEEMKADPIFVAALPSVLKKDAVELSGFDQLVHQHLQELLTEKVASLDAELEAEKARQADAHAEMLGAFAVLDLAKERVR